MPRHIDRCIETKVGKAAAAVVLAGCILSLIHKIAFGTPEQVLCHGADVCAAEGWGVSDCRRGRRRRGCWRV